MRIVRAIVPAAGLSRRFGGENKLLRPWQGDTVVGKVVRTLMDCGLPVLVVTGRDAQEVRLAVSPADSIFNPNYEQGLGVSLACGVSNSPEADGYLIALADMPDLSPDVVIAILERFATLPRSSIVAPVYESEPDRWGHPILFGADYRPDLSALNGDRGARAVVESAGKNLVLVSVGGSLPDIDVPE